MSNGISTNGLVIRYSHSEYRVMPEPLPMNPTGDMLNASVFVNGKRVRLAETLVMRPDVHLHWRRKAFRLIMEIVTLKIQSPHYIEPFNIFKPRFPRRFSYDFALRRVTSQNIEQIVTYAMRVLLRLRPEFHERGRYELNWACQTYHAALDYDDKSVDTIFAIEQSKRTDAATKAIQNFASWWREKYYAPGGEGFKKAMSEFTTAAIQTNA